jgi:hypothetical protein
MATCGCAISEAVREYPGSVVPCTGDFNASLAVTAAGFPGDGDWHAGTARR